ncbi:DUF2897 family protein [Alteromonas gracilis]|uniref:DUF2897 family protein n=1 Tax=Alteromonas gracilis TaxID=1479524 RepID=UPI0030D0F4B3
MDLSWLIVVIVLVLGVVVGNITLLKYSAKFKFPTPTKPSDHPDGTSNADKQMKKKNGFDDEEDW